MPIHDWNRAGANLFHHFHQRWTIAICDVLNSGTLRGGYSALVEQHAAGLVLDVLTLQRRGSEQPTSTPHGGVLTPTPPKTKLVFHATQNLLHLRANRIAIRHRLGEVVCIIEIISPGNKASRSALLSFVKKPREFLEAGVNILVVDLFPPSPRDPGGIHKAIWDELEAEGAFELPADQPLTLAAYVAGDITVGRAIRAYVEPVGIGDPLPDMPAYLDADYHVPVPLESTYQSAWASCPDDMRYLVEHGQLPGE